MEADDAPHESQLTKLHYPPSLRLDGMLNHFTFSVALPKSPTARRTRGTFATMVVEQLLKSQDKGREGLRACAINGLHLPRQEGFFFFCYLVQDTCARQSIRRAEGCGFNIRRFLVYHRRVQRHCLKPRLLLIAHPPRLPCGATEQNASIQFLLCDCSSV